MVAIGQMIRADDRHQRSQHKDCSPGQREVRTGRRTDQASSTNTVNCSQSVDTDHDSVEQQIRIVWNPVILKIQSSAIAEECPENIAGKDGQIAPDPASHKRDDDGGFADRGRQRD